MAENQEKPEKVDGFNKWKSEALASRPIIAELTQKTQELWNKSAELDLQVLSSQKENEALKAKFEALNQTSRNELAKKNAEIDLLQKTQPENEKLLKENGALSAKIQVIENDLLLSVQKFAALKEIENDLNTQISDLKNHYAKLNGSLLASEQNLKELNLQKGSLILQVEALKKSDADLKSRLELLNGANADLKKDNENLKAATIDLTAKFDTTISEMQSEIDNLTWENAAFKKQIGAKNGKMNTFKTVVIFLAVLANFLLLGKKFMGLTGEKDWQTYFISYGSVLIFDLTVIFLTMVNRSKEALYFGIGVFILTFFQIGKPFLGLGLKVAFFGFDLPYFERIISGCIYSFFFAFLSYFLSKIEIKS